MQHISEILPAVMHAIQHKNWEQIITDEELQRMGRTGRYCRKLGSGNGYYRVVTILKIKHFQFKEKE